MKIITLGTSHGDSTLTRFNSSTLYETDDGSLYLVDAGAPCEALIRRKGLQITDLRATFITHMHDDHVGGVPGLLKQVIKHDRGRTGGMTLYLPEERAIGALQTWMSALHEVDRKSWIEYRAVTDGEIYSDENLTVSAIRTCHLRSISRTEGTPCSFAYVLEFRKEQKRILHTGDLWGDFSDFPQIAQEQYFDLCLCEATHYDPRTAVGIMQHARFGRLIFIHVGDRWQIRVGPAWNVENGEEELLSLCKELPYPVQIAHDGDEYLL